jgi:hypothetical protein
MTLRTNGADHTNLNQAEDFSPGKILRLLRTRDDPESIQRGEKKGETHEFNDSTKTERPAFTRTDVTTAQIPVTPQACRIVL